VLKLDSLPDATRRVFEHLSANALLQDFTLIGGTALALQIGHRRSEDLDFWLASESMDKGAVSAIVRIAQDAGFEAELVTPHQQIVTAKINGCDLLAYAQDYVIEGVKITFFARADVAYRYFNTLPRVASAGASFHIMSEEGLFAMKSHVVHQRIRSRDLYDLKTFLQRGKTLADILRVARTADPACSPEYAKSVLVGDVPLDKEDEGFSTVGVAESIEDVYAFFKAAVNEYEQGIAEETAKNASKALHKK
jgi:hypothetical protein